MQLETKFKLKVVEELKKLYPKVWFTKIQQVAKKGDPDIIICINGQFEAWELKTDKGRASKLQDFTLSKIMLAGGVALVVTPESLTYHMQRLSDIAAQGFSTRQ